MSNDIYSYIKENFGIEIIDYKFKRDYIQNPLKKEKINSLCFHLEYPEKDDVVYLFLKINLNREQITKLFNISKTSFSRICKKYNIKKSNELLEKNARKTLQILAKNPDFYKNISIKRKETIQEKYNVEYYSQTNEFKIKFKNTCKERYGVENPSFSSEILEKIKQVKSDRYNNPYFNNMEKNKNTCKERYGVDYYIQSEECKRKCKEGAIKKFGVDNYYKSDLFKERQKNPEFKKQKLEKEIATKIKNGTLGKNISIKETQWLDLLNIPNDKEHRQVLLIINNKQYVVDGFDPINNIVYEFLGDYWHGNPITTVQENINTHRKKYFKELFEDTMKRIKELSTVYKVIYIWENDFNQGLSASNME